jgi:hypothetical protein
MLLCNIKIWMDDLQKTIEVGIFPDFSGNGALRWRAWWSDVMRTPPPRSNEEALARDWMFPKWATVRKDGNYWRIGTWIHG